MKTFVEHITTQLDSIKQTMFELLDNSRIVFRRDDSDSEVVIIAPTQYWDSPTEIEQGIQIRLKKSYGLWIETFKLFTENSPDASKRKIDQTDKFVMNWIEKKSDWDIPNTIGEAKAKFESEIEFFYDTLNLYANNGDKEIIVIPDTNALIQEPEPKTYKTLTASDKLTIIFLPTVLSELDELKIKASNPDFQKKVKSVITRLKGYRQQGNLIEGVIVEKSIKLKMVAAEPNFNRTLSWLDNENNDDRIIASALEIQRDNPSSVVCLVTSDINLQNKTEMARLTYIDVD
ncbi:MAG: twitching motility protein PilT [Candidatus Kapabacteria bacterium]|nr:twitching motility protein PilT [Candidatus Kapabacteria bacterium]